ncbi:MAG: LysE family translocator [Firmicutes bacterium]|nr:LysE family translocator [Bacillota bacterium]
MTLESCIGFILALLIWVAIPGPAILSVVGRSLSSGLKPAILLITGILLGDLFYMSLVLFGLTELGKVLGDFFVFIKIVGASYLIFIGLKMWTQTPEMLHEQSATGSQKKYGNFIAGFTITLGNPKAILFHLGFLPTFFDLQSLRFIDSLLIIVIFMCVLFSAFLAYALAANRARILFKERRSIIIMNRSAGAILIGSGITVATRN